MSCRSSPAMSQHVGHQHLPRGTMLESETPPRRPGRRRKLVIAGVAATLVLGAVSLTVAMRSRSSSREVAPTSDVPRREGNAIVVSPAFREIAGMETAPATRMPLTPLVHAVGAVEFDPTHVAAVGTRAAGVVTKVMQVEGDFVEKGELLAEIESTGLAEAHADLRVAAAKMHAAELNAERERRLLERQLTTAREREEAESALEEQKAVLTAARERVKALGGGPGPDTALSQLRAPVAGVVAQRAIAPGQSVGPGLVAFRVGDVDQLWVILRIFERHVGLVSVGDTVEIRSMSAPDVDIAGEVTHVGAVLDPATRTTNVRVVVADGARPLRPGQSVDATVHASGPAHVALAVPTSAITYVDGAPTVFVAETETRFVPRKVELGIEGVDQVEITNGVRDGERVVSKNVLAVKSELFR